MAALQGERDFAAPELEVLKRVAVLLSGNVRNYALTVPLVADRVARPLDGDVFIHTWNQLDHSDDVWWRTATGATRAKLTNHDLEWLQFALNPRRIEVEDPEQVDIPPETPHWALAVYQMWYGIKAAWQLMLDYEVLLGFKYTHVVRWRFDLVPLRKLDSSDLRTGLALGASDIYSAFGVGSDAAAIGERDTVSVLAALCDKLPTLANRYYQKEPYLEFLPEMLLESYLRSAGQAWKVLDCGLELIRPSGEVFTISRTGSGLGEKHFDPEFIQYRLKRESWEKTGDFIRANIDAYGGSNSAAVASLLVAKQSFNTPSACACAMDTMVRFHDWLALETNDGIADRVVLKWWRSQIRRVGLIRSRALVVRAEPWSWLVRVLALPRCRGGGLWPKTSSLGSIHGG